MCKGYCAHGSTDQFDSSKMKPHEARDCADAGLERISDPWRRLVNAMP
jgi:hypothetical protein